MLRAQGLRKQYGEQVALAGLDLSVPPGEIHCLLGANGAGKTTTLQLFLGFVAPTAGRAVVGDVVVHEAPLAARALTAYVPENVLLYPSLTGLENLEYFVTLSRGARPARAEMLDALGRVGLSPEAAARRVGGYSKGMRQKVGIALALLRNARALLLDEPTSGLDPLASHELSRLLLEVRDSGVAILMATHDLFRVKEGGDGVSILKRGELVASYRTSELGHSDLERVYLEHMHD